MNFTLLALVGLLATPGTSQHIPRWTLNEQEKRALCNSIDIEFHNAMLPKNHPNHAQKRSYDEIGRAYNAHNCKDVTDGCSYCYLGQKHVPKPEYHAPNWQKITDHMNVYHQEIQEFYDNQNKKIQSPLHPFVNTLAQAPDADQDALTGHFLGCVDLVLNLKEISDYSALNQLKHLRIETEFEHYDCEKFILAQSNKNIKK